LDGASIKEPENTEYFKVDFAWTGVLQVLAIGYTILEIG
jgi:hypothetical protein